ncbi:MAG: DinB family protein [Holophagales bacterium]|nr:DinB family protein [Holophagales bacterium]
MSRAERDECDASYWAYVDKVPDGDLLEILQDCLRETLALLSGVPESRERHAYAEGKWTVREVVGHMVDSERVFGMRAFWFARAAEGGLPGMDQDSFAAASNAGERPLSELVDEFETLRRAHLTMLAGFDREAWTRRGEASGCEFTVRALAAIMAGHEIHHRGVLREKYLG